MESFLRRHGWARWVIECYDGWVFGPTHIRETTESGDFTCKDSPIERTLLHLPPATTLDKRRISLRDVTLREDGQTPDACRTNRTTYKYEVWCTVCVDDQPRLVRTCVAKFPRMVGSDAGPMEGGYFIVDGTERAFVNRESMRYDTPRFRHSVTKGKNKWWVDITSLDAPFTLVFNKRKGEIHAHVGFASNRVVLPFHTLLRAMRTAAKNKIEPWTSEDLDKDATTVLLSASVEEEEDALLLVGKAMIKEDMMSGVSAKRAKTYATDVIHQRVLPFILDEDEKIKYLTDVAYDLVMFGLGKRDATDVDAMEHKRIDTAGKFVVRLVCQKLHDMWRVTSERLAKQNLDKDVEHCIEAEYVEKHVNRGMKVSIDPEEKCASVLPRKASWQEALATVRRVNADVGASSFVPGPRMLHGTWYGFYCACETPEGARTGLTRDTALFFKCSRHGDPQKWRDGLRTLPPCKQKEGGAAVFVNQSKFAIMDAYGTLEWCTKFKRERDPYAGIAVIRDPTMYVQTTEPEEWRAAILKSIKLISNTLPVPPGTAQIYVNGELCADGVDKYKSRKWCLLFRKLKSPESVVDHAPIREIRIDVSEGRALRPVWTPNTNVDLDFKGEFDDLIKQGRVEWIDAAQSNCVFVSTSVQEEDTYMDLHPTALLGPSAGNIPFLDHNAGSRNLFGAHVRHQAVGHAHPFATKVPGLAQQHNRFDSDESHTLWHTQRAMCDTKIAREMQSHAFPNGWNAVIFILAKPFGQEDSMGIAQRHVDLGAGVIETELSIEESLTNYPDEWFGSDPAKGHRKIDADGLPRVGELIFPDDVIISKMTRAGESGVVRWHKKFPARVKSVCRVKDGSVMVRMGWRRTPEIGDKLASRHGQKGVINFKMIDTKTYWTADGTTPDLIMNPAALPTRMTMGHMFEMLCGKANAVSPPPGFSSKGCADSVSDCTPYSTSFDFAAVRELLRAHGYQPRGQEIVYNGETGEAMQGCHVFIGPAFIQRLIHFSFTKCYARGRGVRNPQTGQPPKGRRNDGGLRVGEGETKAVQAHGAASTQQAMFLNCSDGIEVTACAECREVGCKERCSVCGANACVPKMGPRSFMLMTDQLRVARINIEMT